MDKLNTKFWYSSQKEKTGQSYSDTVEALINHAKIPVKAVLGNSTLTVADFSQLQVGDIVRLDTKVDQELDVFVGDIKKFQALPGASGKDYAVRVTQIIREEQ
jgi:flagellar motor switch protein FliM